VEKLKEKVEKYNPKKEKLPAGDLGTFSKLKVHFKTEYPIETNLFTKENRTAAIKTLYTKAGDGNETKVNREELAFVCVPVLSDPDKKRNLYLDIETRLPSNYEEFSSRLDDHDSSQKQGAVALKSELVRVDVSGKSFARMTDYRRSLLPANPRRKRRKNRDRRNTLAGGEKFSLIAENQNRTRSHEGQRKAGRSVTPGDVDISLDATTGSSLCTGTIPDMDTSLTSSNAEKTLSDIHLPPPLPELKSNAQLKKLRSMGNKKRGETSNPFISDETEYHQYADEDGQLSPIFSDKDFGQDSYYESLSRLRAVPGRSTRGALVTKGCSNPDGALSSSGIWTASVSEGSDRDDNVANTPSHPEITTPRVLQRPHSSLSMGVISDTESAAETTQEESNDTMTVVEHHNAEEGEEGSIHSCDTEGYYTTFHDFDGFKEVANELKFIEPNESANPFISKVDGNSNLFITEEKDEVVFRKKTRRPALPRRHSSLIKDNRESTDTVIHISDLQEFKTGGDAHDLSNDISFEFSVAGSDIESSEHIHRLELKTAMTSRHIPSLCVVTPPLSDEDSRKTSANTSLNISRSSSEGNQVIINNMQQAEDNFDEKQEKFNLESGNHRSSGDASDKDCLDSDNSAITVDSGKLVSITPDIVKPVKECKPDLTKQRNAEKQNAEDHEVSDMQDGPNPVLNSNSGSHLPDMLTNTPEVSQITCDSVVTYQQAQLLGSTPDSVVMVGKDNLGINSEMPSRPAIGLALGHANKTSCMENPAEKSAPPALLSSVSTGQPNCEQPKLRITSPFSAYSKKQGPDDEEKPSNSIPPSTLHKSQGDLERKDEESEYGPNKLSEQVCERNISVGNQLSHPGDIYNRVNQTLGRMNTDTSSGHISNGIDGTRNSVQRSSLKRSDSYRRARPILSPDLSKNNRKSVEISPSNNSTNLSNNPTNISVGNSSSNKSTNNNCGIQTPSNNSAVHHKDRDDKEKSTPKGNFFKNIRSQFSFSSLRRKPSKKAIIEISTPPDQQKSSDIKRRNSFSSLSPVNKTPPDQPRMTSTPNSDLSLKNANKNIEFEQPKVKSSTEWSESPKNNGVTPIKFRTAALKNQHQRWSYAEQLQSNNQQSVHYMPNNASYGYIYPHQYVLAGHVNTPHGPNTYHHIHHQPQHQPVPSHNRTYGSYGPSTSNPIYAGSQRSSIASLRGLPHDPACAAQTLTKYEAREEGAYGYSVLRRNSSSPPSKPASDAQSTGRSSQLSNHKSCDCPMCYHSVKNPCAECGCPTRSQGSLSLKVNVKQRGPAFTDQQTTQAFFSPSSDYYSLSPNSPPPEDLNHPDHGYSDSSESSQPIYAKVNKIKASDVKNSELNKRNDENRGGRSVDKTNFDNNYPTIPKNASVSMHHRSSTEPGKKPAAPERDLNFPKDKSGRRHSWAGDKKGPGIQKQTSLHDFKKLLAQQATGQNPHRISAKELLEKSVADKEAPEGCKSSQKSGGSLRKRSSPWKDNRFSVIQEEIEGSKENLLNGKN
jgi:hypothetical protein